MTHIEQFTIHGLAGHKEPVSRHLDRHTNIFWGLNGTGKTSLLKILHAALSDVTTGLDRLPFDRAEVIFCSMDMKTRLKRTYTNENADDEGGDVDDYELEEVGDGLWRRIESPTLSAWQTETLDGEPSNSANRYRHTYLPISRMTESADRFSPSARTRTLDENAIDKQFAQQVRFKWQRYNSSALASIRAIQQQGLASILAHLFGGGAGTASVNSESVSGAEAHEIVRDFLEEQDISLRVGQKEFLERYEKESDLRNVVANIQEVKSEVEEALRPQQDFQKVIQKLYSGGKQLILDTDRRPIGSIQVAIEGGLIPLEALSSGEKQLLRLLLETLAAESNTVMIDEPEISMHVDWQQVLVASMRKINPECQLLLATHSPEVMAEVPEKYVFQL